MMANYYEFYDDQSEDGRDYGPEVTREDIEIALGPGWEVIEHNKTPSSAAEVSEDVTSGKLIIPKMDVWRDKESITMQEQRRSLSIRTEDSEDIRRECEEKYLVDAEIDLMLNALEEELNNKSLDSISNPLRKSSQQDTSANDIQSDADPDYDLQGIFVKEEGILPHHQQSHSVLNPDPDDAEYDMKKYKNDESMHELSIILDTFVQRVGKYLFRDTAVADKVQEYGEIDDSHDINTLMPWHIDPTFES